MEELDTLKGKGRDAEAVKKRLLGLKLTEGFNDSDNDGEDDGSDDNSGSESSQSSQASPRVIRNEQTRRLDDGMSDVVVESSGLSTDISLSLDPVPTTKETSPQSATSATAEARPKATKSGKRLKKKAKGSADMAVAGELVDSDAE